MVQIPGRRAEKQQRKAAELYDEFSRLKQETDRLRASRNENSAAMKVLQAVIGAAGWRRGLKGGGGQKRRARRAQTPRRRRRSRALNPLTTTKQKKGKLEPEARAALVSCGQALKAELEALEAALGAAEGALQVEGQRLPNLTHPAVPVGGEDVAAVVRGVGAPRDVISEEASSS